MIALQVEIHASLAGGRTADEMVRWLKKRTGPAAEDLKSADAARTFVDASKVSVVGFFKDQASSEAMQFLEAAEAIDAHPFAITSDDAVYKELGASKDGVILFKKVSMG